MLIADIHTSVGLALDLLARSPYHSRQPVSSYIQVEVLPALSCRQARFYVSDDGIPTAMVTWAWLSAEVEADVHASGRALGASEWHCGDRLFFNDFVAPYGNVRDVLHDLTHNIFPDRIASSLRRRTDGSVRRINRWVGANLTGHSSENSGEPAMEGTA